MSNRQSTRPQWQTTALHSAIAALCANGLFIGQAMATVPDCGPTVSDSQGQCTPQQSAEVVIQQGVTVSQTNAPAVLYLGDLGISEGQYTSGSLTNNGSILSSGLGEDSVSNFYFDFDDFSFSSANSVAGVFIGNELVGRITNNGLISGELASLDNGTSAAFGILEAGSPAMVGSIINSGTINASSTALNGGAFAAGIFIREDIAAGALIDNKQTGEITASATGIGAYALGITAGSLSGMIENAGLISAQSALVNADGNFAIAVGVLAEEFSGTVNNRGTISASLVNGAEGQAFGMVFTRMNGGVVNNYGTIEADGGEGGVGVSILSYDSEGSGTINNMQGGTLRGILAVSGSGVNVNNAGVIDLSDSPFESSVGGNFTQTDSGTLRLMASGDGEDQYSQLSVGGTASIAGKAYVDVKEINTLAVGQTLSGVVSAFELTGNFAQVEDNSALFNFQSVSTEGVDGHIDFKLVKALTAVEAVNSNNNPSGRGAAGALDTIIDRGTTNPSMQKLIDALGQLGTSKQVSDAIAQTTPLLAANTVLASRAALGGISRVIQSRIESNRGMSSGDEFYGDRKVWLKPFGSWAEQDDRSGVSGFDANTSGIVLGADGTLSDSTRIGVAFAYANTNIDGNSNIAPNSADVDMYQVLGYGSHSLDQNTELNFQAGIGQNNTDGKRDILFLGETARADYSSLVATAGVGLARTFELSEKTAFTPSVRTDYTWIKDEGYSEKGSSANLKVDAKSTDQMIVGLDGKLSHEFMPGTSIVANLGVGYDILNSQSSVTSAFAAEPGVGFTTRGLDSSPWSQRAGLGLTHATEDGVEVSLRYDAEHSEGFLNQTASVKLRWGI